MGDGFRLKWCTLTNVIWFACFSTEIMLNCNAKKLDTQFSLFYGTCLFFPEEFKIEMK